jgi:hypothetical protein
MTRVARLKSHRHRIIKLYKSNALGSFYIVFCASLKGITRDGVLEVGWQPGSGGRTVEREPPPGVESASIVPSVLLPARILFSAQRSQTAAESFSTLVHRDPRSQSRDGGRQLNQTAYRLAYMKALLSTGTGKA